MIPSEPLTCLLLPHEDGDGPENMARDEALLELVAAAPDAAAFRTYGWTEPTLSLGYFQSIGEVESDPRWRPVPVVRRPTGGGAIWHDRELTYALAVPRSSPLSRQGVALYRAVHGAIAGLLSGFGLDARRRGGDALPPGGVRPRPFLCFTDLDPEDIVSGPVKLVGSAQRRRSGAILQHGSVLLVCSDRAPELPGASDVGAVPGDPAVWADLLRRRLPEALGFRSEPARWSASVRARAREIEAMVYRNPGWTRRR
jgi:lipoate-protein ligase A